MGTTRNNTKKLRKQKHITYSSILENVLKRETMKQNTTKKQKKLDNNKIKKKELKVMSLVIPMWHPAI
jgi:hypothetical protein